MSKDRHAPYSLHTMFYVFLFLLASCRQTSSTPIPLSSESSLFAVSDSSLLEFDSNFNIVNEITVYLPCPLTSTHPAPRGRYLALELECNNGPLVVVVDMVSEVWGTPFTETDSHFLAWDFQSNLYLRVDALGNTRLIRVTPDGSAKQFNLSAQTYDMDFSPDGQTLAYSFTRGLGLGSELWGATSSASRTWQLHADSDSIITFARWSPDGQHIAFINLPDTSIPFPVGELWVMDANGHNARPLAPADAGHGYAPTWSPDSTRIAFVGRENPNDPAADQSADALVSNIYVVDVANGEVKPITHFEGALVEAPLWSADGHFLAFIVVHVLDDKMTVWIADLVSGQVTPLASTDPLCCPAWIRP